MPLSDKIVFLVDKRTKGLVTSDTLNRFIRVLYQSREAKGVAINICFWDLIFKTTFVGYCTLTTTSEYASKRVPIKQLQAVLSGQY